MTVPASISSAVSGFAAAVTAANPLKNQTRILLTSLETQGLQVVAAVENEILTYDAQYAQTPVPIGTQRLALDFSSDFFQPDFSSLLVPLYPPNAPQASTDDVPDPTGFPGDLVAYLQSLLTNCQDQAALCDARGLVGRAMFNLQQVTT